MNVLECTSAYVYGCTILDCILMPPDCDVLVLFLFIRAILILGLALCFTTSINGKASLKGRESIQEITYEKAAPTTQHPDLMGHPTDSC